VLGLNDGHTAAACLYQDGQVRAAIQEERLRRIKNWSGMPTEAIATVLRMTDTRPEEIDFVALNGRWAAFPMTREQLMEEYRTINDLGVSLQRSAKRAIARAAQATGRNGRLERLHAVEKADSIGNIYAMVTYLMGMVPLEHEYKLMGLAPYADPKGVEKVYEALRRLIRFDARNPLGWERAAGCPETY